MDFKQREKWEIQIGLTSQVAGRKRQTDLLPRDGFKYYLGHACESGGFNHWEARLVGEWLRRVLPSDQNDLTWHLLSPNLPSPFILIDAWFAHKNHVTVPLLRKGVSFLLDYLCCFQLPALSDSTYICSHGSGLPSFINKLY